MKKTSLSAADVVEKLKDPDVIEENGAVMVIVHQDWDKRDLYMKQLEEMLNKMGYCRSYGVKKG